MWGLTDDWTYVSGKCFWKRVRIDMLTIESRHKLSNSSDFGFVSFLPLLLLCLSKFKHFSFLGKWKGNPSKMVQKKGNYGWKNCLNILKKFKNT